MTEDLPGHSQGAAAPHRRRYTLGLSLSLVAINVLTVILFIWLFGPFSGV